MDVDEFDIGVGRLEVFVELKRFWVIDFGGPGRRREYGGGILDVEDFGSSGKWSRLGESLQRRAPFQRLRRNLQLYEISLIAEFIQDIRVVEKDILAQVDRLMGCQLSVPYIIS